MKSRYIFFLFIWMFCNPFSQALAQGETQYYLRITPFESPQDSLTLLAELRFWQEFREQAERSQTVNIAAGWDQIVTLSEYAEETARTPAIFDTSTISAPAMIAPGYHLQGNIRYRGKQALEVDLTILNIQNGTQTAAEHGRIPLSNDPFKDETAPALRRIIRMLLEPLDPQLQKQREWLGEPFSPEKINILVTDFTDVNGKVDERGKAWATKIFNELRQFMENDEALQDVAEVKRLYAEASGVTIREKDRARETAERLYADMIIWGQNLCITDSVCYFAKALITHEARTATTIQEGVIHQTQLLRADLPLLIGAEANVLVRFIIGWTYLNDQRYLQFQQALTYLQQALEGAKDKNRSDLLKWAARAALDAGQYGQALQWYKKLEEIQTLTVDRGNLATTYNQIGLIYDKKGDWDKALVFHRKSEAIRLELGDKTGLAATYNGIGGIYYQKGDWDKALIFYEKSEAIRLEMGNKVGLARIYNNIGLIYDNKGDWDKALVFYEKSETIFLEVGDKANLAKSYNNIGLVYDKKGDWDKALVFYEKSEAIHLEVGNKAELATTYNNIGVIYDKKGDWVKALVFHGKSEVIRLEVGDKAGLAPTYNNIGIIYDKKGDWDKALVFHEKSEAIRLEVGDRAGLATTYNSIGGIYYQKGDWDEALFFYGKSEAVSLEVGDKVELANTYHGIGGIYDKKGDWDKALVFYEKSEAIYLEIGYRAGLNAIYTSIASVFYKKGSLSKALEYGQQSLQIALDVGDPVSEALSRWWLAIILKDQQQYSDAISHLENSVKIYQHLKHPNQKEVFQELLNVQLLSYSATGTHYVLLDDYLARMSDLQKGEFFLRIPDWPRATQFYHRYWQANTDSMDAGEKASLENLIGIGYIKQNMGDSAIVYLQPALAAFQQLRDQEMVGTLYNNLGSAHKIRRAWPEAQQWLRKSITHNRAIAGDSAAVLGYTYYHLADVFQQTEQPDSARYYIQKSRHIRETLEDDEGLQETLELQEKIQLLKKQ